MFVTSEIFGNNNIVESRYSYFVGELGASWQSPSDHLPRGATVGNFHIAFWNILNKDYLNHIEENTQGLRHSSIIKDNVPVDSSNTLTINEEAQTQAQILFQYFLDEVVLDAFITRERQDEKVQEFKILADNLTPEVASILTNLLLEETHVRIIQILQNARLDELEIEEHHLESYSKDNIDSFSDEHLQNNMLEATADMLAATKQRGGGLLTDWLVNAFSKTNPHPRLIPFLENGLRKAHAFYLESVKNSDSDSIFKGLPCWNNETEEVFRRLASSSSEP